MSMQTRLLNLRRIHPQGLAPKLEVLYSPAVSPQPFDREKLMNFSPTRFVVRDRLDQQPADRLTWNFVTHPSRSEIPLATMRNKLARRWKEAMRVALKHNGFECNGKKPAAGPGAPRADGLKGTLTVLVHRGTGLDMSAEDLIRNADKIVKAIR